MKVFLVLVGLLGWAYAEMEEFDCATMLPVNREEHEAETSSTFRVSVERFQDEILPEARRQVTLSGEMPIHSFMIQCHHPMNPAMGTWEEYGQEHTTGSCSQSGADTLTNVHLEQPLTSVTATWVAPQILHHNEIECLATVVTSEGRFFHEINSALIPARHIDPEEQEKPAPKDDEEVAAPAPQEDAAPQGTGEDPNEPERIEKEAHDTAVRHDTEGPMDQPVVDNPDETVLHDTRKEDEMEAAWKEKKQKMIEDEERNSEGSFNRAEIQEKEEHEKEMHEEEMAYELEKAEREKIRMERMRAEIRDKEEYDRQKAEEARRLEEERQRELEMERKRQEEEEELGDNVVNVGGARKGKATAGSERIVSGVATILTIIFAMIL